MWIFVCVRGQLCLAYTLEAHFVVRDGATGAFVEGWPVGYEAKWEFPQHKSMDDRRAMVRVLRERFAEETRGLPVVVEAFPKNELYELYGVWPDTLLAFDAERLVFRACCRPDGLRVPFDEQLEEFLLERERGGREGEE
jgi:hypothetical protein